MPSWTIALAFGIALPAGFPALPQMWLMILFANTALLARARFHHRLFTYVLALALGLCWGVGYGHRIVAGLLPPALEREPLTLTGRVHGLVEHTQSHGRPASRFRFSVDSCRLANGADCPVSLRRLQLSWYSDAAPMADQRWQLEVRLRRPHGFANPGGFDYETWLVAQGVGATGSVRHAGDNQLLAPARWWHPAHRRQRVKDRLSDRLAGMPSRPFLLALLVGDGSALDDAHWQRLRDTGTVHLFVVSGLHVALTGGLLLAAAALWRRTPASRGRRASYRIAWGAAAVGACLYALLAGFGLPIQRALVMFAVAGVATAGWRERRPRDAWWLALLLVVLFDPLAVLQAGFWFSFLAVAAILAVVVGRRGPRQPWLLARTARRWWQVQWATFAIGTPVLLMLAGTVPLISLAANLIAIPLVSLLALPLALMAALCELAWGGASLPVWRVADGCLQWLWRYLGVLQDQGAWLQWRPAGWSGEALLLAMVAAGLALLPRPFPGRWLVAVLLLPLLVPPREPLADGEARVRILDVGQGLSVLVQTSGHALLYDTGPVFGSGTAVADLTVLPALQRLGVRRLDMLLLSHSDSDHAGGWRSVVGSLAVGATRVGEPVGAAGEMPCRGGDRWDWDGVAFHVLHPTWISTKGNDNSCVLWITATGPQAAALPPGSLLLPGDIERGAERQLVWDNALMPADIVVAPHHGSRSSSSLAFVGATRPRYAIFSAGYRNAFNHPDAAVVDRYEAAGALPLSTAEEGMLQFRLHAGGVELERAYRRERQRYWQNQ